MGLYRSPPDLEDEIDIWTGITALLFQRSRIKRCVRESPWFWKPFRATKRSCRKYALYIYILCFIGPLLSCSMKSLSIPQVKKDQQKQLNRTTLKLTSSVQQIRVHDQLAYSVSGTTINMVNLNSFELSKKLCRSKAVVNDTDLRFDKELLVSADEGGQIICTVVKSQTQLKKLFGLKQAATLARFTPDGYSVIGANKAGNLLVWDLATGETTFAVHLSNDKISDLVFLDNETAAVSSYDGTLYIVNFRVPEIQPDISEGKVKTAISPYCLNKLEIGSKITKLLLISKTIYAVTGDHIVEINC